ncbi:MAG: hypothetical protein ACRDFX_13955, partial [Chloroflexota bacterium]
MPVQKGKKKPKRIRRQFGSLGTEEENGAHEAPTTTRTSARSGRAKPARRERKKAPLWVNTTIGG